MLNLEDLEIVLFGCVQLVRSLNTRLIRGLPLRRRLTFRARVSTRFSTAPKRGKGLTGARVWCTSLRVRKLSVHLPARFSRHR